MNWEEDKETITTQYFGAINKNNTMLYGLIKEHFNPLIRLIPLVDFIISRLETVSTLTLMDRLWDAEIVLRSALETYTKLLFITSSKKDEQKTKIEEFWNSLSEINRIKQSEQAKRNLKILGDLEIHRLAYSPLVLSEVEENQLREKWPKKKRRKIEQNWSFTEIINHVSKNYNSSEFEAIIPLLHTYRMSSHVMHGDETGISIIQERQSRNSKEKEIVERAHYLRLISDCLTYSTFTAIEICNFVDTPENATSFFKTKKGLKKVDELIERYNMLVFEDDLYAKYKI